MEKTVKFTPEATKVEKGLVFALTEVFVPETDKTHRSETEISAFECTCGNGCPQMIFMVQKVTNRKNPTEARIDEISIAPEDLDTFIDALKKAKEAILMKQN
jgi:hypothetical protein